MTKRAKGKLAEERAKQALIKRGYRVIAENFSCRFGEVDLIAFQNEILCFIEVRSRSSTKFALPHESVDFRKQKRLIKTAQEFLHRFSSSPPSCRFDVVGMYPGKDGSEVVDILEGAFEVF